MKKMLTVDEQIEHMKAKGITFNFISEEEAKNFLSNNNYYMKLASYRSNYEKRNSGAREGQYINLDFACLKELSTLDMHLRYYIIEMCLDIEHAIKVRLIKHISNNPEEDGYRAVRLFLAQDKDFKTLKNIKSHGTSAYCKELIEKYYPFFPAWVFVELVSFGTLLHFCAFYMALYNVELFNNALMNTVRDLRNACAHSNCLLNHLSQKIDETKQPDHDITSFVSKMSGISDASRRNNLKSLFTYNFVVLLYIYDTLVSPAAKEKRYEQLKNFFCGSRSSEQILFHIKSKNYQCL